MQVADIFRALANSHRLQILEWLKEPCAHFPPQVYGDLEEDGVCGQLLSDKLGLSPSTLSEHMRVLVQAGFVIPKRIKQWTFYKRDEAVIAELATVTVGLLSKDRKLDESNGERPEDTPASRRPEAARVPFFDHASE